LFNRAIVQLTVRFKQLVIKDEPLNIDNITLPSIQKKHTTKPQASTVPPLAGSNLPMSQKRSKVPKQIWGWTSQKP